MTVRHLHIAPDAAPTSRLLFFSVFVGTWLAEVQGWPFEAKGAYHLLRVAQWTMISLPADPNALRKLIGASRSQWKIAWPYVAPKFPLHGKGRQNAELEQHRCYALQRLERCRAGANATNRRRYGHDHVG
jgi:uncharacterized protein YdaU (DUF1376 family)